MRTDSSCRVGGWVGEGAVHVLDAVLCGEGPRVPVVVERVHPITRYIMLTMEKKNDEGNRNENEEGGRVECVNRLG